MSPPPLPKAPHHNSDNSAPLVGTTTATIFSVTALFGTTLAFYHNLWLPDLVLIKRDAFWFFPPLKHYLVDRLAAGELPQWYPYEGLGRPFIAATHTGVFHPFTALYALLPTIHTGQRIVTLLSCLLAALGAFVLGRTLNLSQTGALLAGIAFALSGYVVSLTDNLTYLYSICLLPLFCLFLEKALNNARAWVVAPATTWATVFLMGDIQTGYYYGFIAVLWGMTRASVSYRETSLRLVLVCGLAALLAGIQLGPAWAVFVESSRAQPALFQEQVLRWSTHPLRLVTMLASPVGGDADPTAVARFFFGNPNYGLWAESLYIGMPVTGLAFLGAWHRRDLRVLVLLCGLALLLSLGRYGGLYTVFYQVMPLWSVFRYPEKFMGIVAFAITMLAGAGIDTLRVGKGTPLPWLAAATLCVGAGLALHADAASAWVAEAFSAPEALTQEVTRSAGLAFFYSAVAVIGVWLVVIGTKEGWLRPAFHLAALVAIVVLDLTRANFTAYHTGPAKTATFTPAFAKTLEELERPLKPGRFRLISTTQSETMWPAYLNRRLGYHGAMTVARRQALDLGHNAEFHIEAVHPHLPGYSRALAVLLQQESSMAVMARFNVTYYIDRRYRLNDPRVAGGLVSEIPDYDLALFRNPIAVKPRAYLSQRPERASSPVDPAVLIRRPDFLNGEVDVIETANSTLPDPARGGVVVIQEYNPEEVQVRIATPQPAILILLDAYDNGWTAKLESGLELPIMRANALVRAVAVPVGTHLVTFSYQTPLLKTGAAASLAGCLLCIGLITHAWWRRRHPAGPYR